MKDSRAQGDIDALVANFFSVFDNRDGATPQLSASTNCFTDKARLFVNRMVAWLYQAVHGTDITGSVSLERRNLSPFCVEGLLEQREISRLRSK